MGFERIQIEMIFFARKTSLVKAMRVDLLATALCSQAKEGMWGMPGHTEARKAVVSCEKLGGVAHTR